MKRVAIYYYSYTDQCHKVSERIAAALPSTVAVSQHRIIVDDPAWQLVVPLQPFWRRFLGTLWPTRHEQPIAIHVEPEPVDADLAIVGGPTWWSVPSLPMIAFLKSAAAARALADKPVGLFVGCRGVFRPNLARMTTLVGALGGRVLGSEVFRFTGGLLGTFMTFFSYVMSGQRRTRWLGVRLPSYGFTEESLAQVTGFVARLTAAARPALARPPTPAPSSEPTTTEPRVEP